MGHATPSGAVTLVIRSSTLSPRIGSAGWLAAQLTTTERRPLCVAMFQRA